MFTVQDICEKNVLNIDISHNAYIKRSHVFGSSHDVLMQRPHGIDSSNNTTIQRPHDINSSHDVSVRGGFIPYLNITSLAKQNPNLTSKTCHLTSLTITTDLTSQRIH